MEPLYIQPGLYVHYKGALYWLLHTTRFHDENVEAGGHAVYLSQKHMALGPVSRPLRASVGDEDGWTDQVVWPDGKCRQRFTPAFVCVDDAGEEFIELGDGTRVATPVEG